MYLAEQNRAGVNRYQIRESYSCGDHSFCSRTLFDLGENPARNFEIYEDFIVLFNKDLLVAIEPGLGSNTEQQLELLLKDFLPRRARQNIDLFKRAGQGQYGPLSDAEKEAIARQIHIFDRRRLYYLRYGGVDQSRLSRLHEKCCRPLLGQSRDEREYYFRAEEKILEPGLYLQYVYAIFNLQKHFSQSFAPWLPESLAIEEMGEHLEQEVCQLQRDPGFWQKKPESHFLHPHLARYLIMFFDFQARPRSFLDEFSRSFMNSRRNFRWPEKKAEARPEKISEVFQAPYDLLQKMSRDQLTKLYRTKALELHPDTGGDHQAFIELTEIYKDLLRGK
jgi:hypothetical protein